MVQVTAFEIHASRPQVLVDFYSSLIDWRFRGGPDYWRIDSGSGEPPGRGGGLIPRRGPAALEGQAGNAFICSVEVPSLAARRAKDPGVNILGWTHQYPGAEEQRRCPDR